MIEFGHILLIVSFVFGLMQVVTSLYSINNNNFSYFKHCVYFNMFSFFAITLSILILIYGFISSDFSLFIVFENSHFLMPTMYKAVALWGNHEGSMMLWCWVLSLFGVLLMLWLNKVNDDIKLKFYVIIVAGAVYSIFTSFLLFTSNPYERKFPVPTGGKDLNPLLQDIGLIIHPPILYIGFVGVAVIYILIIAGLFNNKVDENLNKLIRPWALLSWAFLTLGIGIGSWWAYYELGWGGFWFWDPVENISLMPWLIVGALLHTILLQKNDNKHQHWVCILGIGAFGISLLGTFLVRSGILSSVHSFVEDQLRGLYLMIIFFVIVVGGYLVYGIKYDYIFTNNKKTNPNKTFNNFLIIKIVVVLTILSTVLIGTLYPVLLETFVNKKISIGTGYFKTTFIPLSVLLLFVMGLITTIKNKKIMIYIIIVITLLSLIISYLFNIKTFMAIGGISLSLWVIITAIYDFKTKYYKTKSFSALGGVISHIGVGILAIGITGATTLSKNYITTLQVGEIKQVGDISIGLNKIDTSTKDNYSVLIGEVEIKMANNKFMFYPEKRRFIARDTVTVETAIKNTVLYDMVVALGNINGNDVTIMVYKKSLMIWIWIGVFIMFTGGLINGIYRLRKKEIK